MNGLELSRHYYYEVVRAMSRGIPSTCDGDEFYRTDESATGFELKESSVWDWIKKP